MVGWETPKGKLFATLKEDYVNGDLGFDPLGTPTTTTITTATTATTTTAAAAAAAVAARATTTSTTTTTYSRTVTNAVTTTIRPDTLQRRRFQHDAHQGAPGTSYYI
jgi:hypothetical protein